MRYETIIQCSPTIQKWADEMVDDYINKFELGELDELYWRVKNPFEKIELYPSAIAFLQKAYNNAKHLNTLSSESQYSLLRALGSEIPSFVNECVFWLFKTMSFTDKYNHDSFIIKKTKVELNSQNAEQFVDSKITEINTKCKEARELIYNIRYSESLLKDLLTKFTDGEIKKSTSVDEKDISYEITKINYWSIQYTRTYLFLGRTREQQHSAKKNEATDFDNILVMLRKYNNRCSYCGGKFKWFSKSCSICGKLKDY